MKLFTFVVLACFAVCNCADTSKDNKDTMVSSSYGGGGSGGYGGGGSSNSYSAPAAPPAAAYGSPAAPSYSSSAAPSYAGPAGPSYSAPAPSKPVAHAPISIPAPPCPRNYLFSCSPNLAPAPCNAAAPHSHGSAGAYSQYVPIYAVPPSVRYY